MNRFKAFPFVVGLTLFLVLICGVIAQPISFALSDDPVSPPSVSPAQESPDEQIVVDCKYPVIRSNTGDFFGYDVELLHKGGKEPRLFDIRVTVLPGFNYTIQRSYGQGEISAVRLDANMTYPETIKVNMTPYAWLAPDPGEYPITVEVSSGDLKGSIELKAIVTVKYDLSVEPLSGRFNVDATSGKDNYFTIIVSNEGSADFTNIVFNSKTRGAPSDWSITFKPEKIDLLKVGDQREVEVDIKPSSKTIAGDYMVNISAEPESKYAFDSAEMRVTVLTPSIWGWVGVGVVVLVIIGLAVMFVRLGRR